MDISVEADGLWDYVEKETLKMYKEQFEAGNNIALLKCLKFCFSVSPTKVPVPNWCAEAFVNLVYRTLSYEFKSWDDAFGPPHPKGTEIATQRNLWKNRRAVHKAVEAEKKKGIPVDAALFEKVGKALGIGGKTTVSNHYYHMKNHIEGYKVFRWINEMIEIDGHTLDDWVFEKAAEHFGTTAKRTRYLFKFAWADMHGENIK